MKSPKRSEMHNVKYYVYILECADKSFYVGCTNNIEKRLNSITNPNMERITLNFGDQLFYYIQKHLIY
ncbi:GIY-YIG nuclease family protein [Patescibacteria group bacterium]|nr:GIY-YIG nuclease family protein [Patescibacteria group bacterium]